MSRIGKKAVTIPAGVKVEVGDGTLTVTGKKGSLSRIIPEKVAVEVSGTEATVRLLDEGAGNLYGMYRTLLSNMVRASARASPGFSRSSASATRPRSSRGASSWRWGIPTRSIFPLPQGITAEVEANTVIKLTGMDKELVGQTAARIRMLRKPDAYKNKGIRYRGERLVKKVGKAAGK